MCHNTSATFTNPKHNNFGTKIRTVLPAIKSTTSVCVDCVTCVPSTFTITSFSRIPARSAAPPDRTVWTETGLSPDKVKPNPDCSSRLTISVRVLSVVVVEGEAALGLLAPLKLEWKGIWKIPGNIPAVTEWSFYRSGTIILASKSVKKLSLKIKMSKYIFLQAGEIKPRNRLVHWLQNGVHSW